MACSDDDDNDDYAPNPNPGTEEGLTFSVSKQVIQADGKDKSDFIIKFNGRDVTEGVTVYDGEDNLLGTNVTSFSTTEPGEYKFWATYRSEHTEMVTVKAIGIPVPELPADPSPERTDFTKRVLLTHFTGTACQYCPYMTTAVSGALKDPAYADKAIWAVAHTFNHSDPGYLTDDRLAQAFGISSYPTINIDFISSFNYYRGFNEAAVRSIIDQAYEFPANAGVSAKAELIDDKDGKKIALHVAVKAAEDGEYSVGAWLMEDGIFGPQQTDGHIEGNFNTHNNVLRVVDSKAGFNDYAGIRLGKIAKGKTAEHVFIMNLKDKWVLENCHMAIFVSQHKNKYISVTNVVPCPVEGTINFDYLKK